MSPCQIDKPAKGHDKNYIHSYRHTTLLSDNNLILKFVDASAAIFFLLYNNYISKFSIICSYMITQIMPSFNVGEGITVKIL